MNSYGCNYLASIPHAVYLPFASRFFAATGPSASGPLYRQ